MSDQQEKKSEEQTPKKSKRKKWMVILAIFACMVVYTEFIADERISPEDKADEILLSTRHRVYNNVNRDGAIVTKFPDRWDWWSDKFEFKRIGATKRDDNYISNYRMRYNVEVLLAIASVYFCKIKKVTVAPRKVLR